MQLEKNRRGRELRVVLSGELDHHNAEKLKIGADKIIQSRNIRSIVFDFGKTSFMDSSGIGMIVGRYKLISMLGGKLVMRNVKENLQKILDMSGVTKIIPLEQSKVN